MHPNSGPNGKPTPPPPSGISTREIKYYTILSLYRPDRPDDTDKYLGAYVSYKEALGNTVEQLYRWERHSSLVALDQDLWKCRDKRTKMYDIRGDTNFMITLHHALDFHSQSLESGPQRHSIDTVSDVGEYQQV